MPTLGARLGTTLRNNQLEAARKAEAEKAAAIAAENARKQRVRINFMEFRSKIQSAIISGQSQVSYRISDRHRDPKTPYGTKPNSPSHRDYDLWVEFEVWAASEELAVSVVDEHDGCGMESWWTLIVRPSLTVSQA